MEFIKYPAYNNKNYQNENFGYDIVISEKLLE